ncbi:TonB-dependent receptor [Nitratifractor sp.]
MKKTVLLSVAAAATLWAAPSEDLGAIDVNASAFETTVVEDVAGEEIRSADVAAALALKVPGVTLVRRSAIANDIIVRGLKKDNLSVTIDGAQIYGACPNRMDPPISHVLANNIDNIEVTEGPFDVTEPGALGASIKINTLKPAKEFAGDINLGLGSWKYSKLSTNLSGGTDTFRFMLSLSTETSDQYKDGNGDTFAEQQDRYIREHPSAAGLGYLPQYRDLKAYTKSTMMGKIFWDVTDDQTLQMSYTANRSNNILYPNTPMDADYDNSDLFDTKYIFRSLGAYSDKLTLHYYRTKVDHPMSNRYRTSSLTKGVIKHWLTTQVDGAALVNEYRIGEHNLESGLEFSRRNWDGKYYKNDTPFPAALFHSIYDVDTDDYGAYTKDRFATGSVDWNLGVRLDHYKIDTPRPGDRDRTFDGVSGNLLASYRLNEAWTLFLGTGSSMRVPDPKELYYRNKTGVMVGNDNLDAVRNYEIDTGAEWNVDDLSLRLKGFYNYLSNDILYNATAQKYENDDAYIYGVELTGSYTYSDTLYFDGSFTWLRGKKKDPLSGQSDTDLPDISPMKVTLAANWSPWEDTMLRAEFMASGRWKHIDSDNGEQVIAGWGIVNLKAQKSWGEHLELTVGIDNLFDKTYAVSNTYKDLTLISGGTDAPTMLLNEPGRYVYANIRYKF